MTYATVCSGVEAMSLAVRGMGWSPVFFSEIEPFPCALLAHHYPSVPNLGDMTKITARFDEKKNQTEITNGTDEPIRLRGRLGCLAGGTPCQDVSVAGKRAGMAEGSGTRSSLAFHFARLCRELRPTWVLWENVPGVLSANGGRDFARFLDAIADCGYSLAWRVLDCQYVRVDGFDRAIPQRRRRVWVVGHIGDDWRTPAEVLFEPKDVRGDLPPCRKTRQEVAGTACDRADGHDRGVEARGFDMLAFGKYGTGGAGSTLKQRDYKDATDLVVHCIALDGDKLKPRKDSGAGGNGFGVNEDNVSYTQSTVDRHGVCYELAGVDFYNLAVSDTSQTIASVASTDKNKIGGVIDGRNFRYVVRRITPLESERLMGFPDGYTQIPWRGKPAAECSDAPRYRACGNSWAVNCARWIVRRIDERDRLARANQNGKAVKEVRP